MLHRELQFLITFTFKAAKQYVFHSRIAVIPIFLGKQLHFEFRIQRLPGLKTLFLKEHLRWLLLYITVIIFKNEVSDSKVFGSP